MQIYVPSGGPCPASVAVVGEAPGGDEERLLKPFCGPTGNLLDELLQGNGIARGGCFVANVCRFRPPGNQLSEFIDSRKKSISRGLIPYNGLYVAPFVPEHIQILKREIEECHPNVVIALGNAALWALTGEWGILDWRGSTMPSTLCYHRDGSPIKVIPTIHPAAIFRQYPHKVLVAHDMRRIAKQAEFPQICQPPYEFVVRPAFQQTIDFLYHLKELLVQGEHFKLSLDIETRKGQIACLGIGLSPLKAFCIPFLIRQHPYSYWSREEELAVILLLQEVLTHPNVACVGQNFLYDSQYIAKQWGFVPRIVRDTMITHHTCFPALEKSLVMQSSLYCDFHCYWKDEGKEWNFKIDESQFWTYNCKDCVITYECDDVLLQLMYTLHREDQCHFQNSLFYPALRMMLRGVKRDLKKTNDYDLELEKALAERQTFLDNVCGHSLNPSSPVQLQHLFYDDLQIKPVIHRKTQRPTVDEDAMEKIASREPLVQPITKVINEYRSLRLVKATFVDAACDADGRIRCSYNVAGTLTYRWSSSTDAFGMGGNLQNITKGGSSKIAEFCREKGAQTIQALSQALDIPKEKLWDDLDKLVESGAIDIAGQDDRAVVSYRLLTPNVRKLFVPDEGYIWTDWDLDRADLQVVAWEADDENLKKLLKANVDMHSLHAKELGLSRPIAKRWCHATNYGIRPRTSASSCGLTIHAAERAQKRYFQMYPGILLWHRRIEKSLLETRSVQNAFGYVCVFFDRLETLLPKALAWIPQSTVALVINTGLERVDRELPDVQILLQVHDSLDIQIPSAHFKDLVPKVRQCLTVVVPYPDPLIIPVTMKKSGISWGDCEN